MPRLGCSGMGWETWQSHLEALRGGKRVRASLGCTRRSLMPLGTTQNQRAVNGFPERNGQKSKRWRGLRAEGALLLAPLVRHDSQIAQMEHFAVHREAQVGLPGAFHESTFGLHGPRDKARTTEQRPP